MSMLSLLTPSRGDASVTEPAKARARSTFYRFVLFGEPSDTYLGYERSVIAAPGEVMTGVETVYTNFNNVPQLMGVRPLFTPVVDVVKAIRTTGEPLAAIPLAVDKKESLSNGLGGLVGKEIVSKTTLAPRGCAIVGITVVMNYGVDSIRLKYARLAADGETSDPTDPGTESEWLGRTPQPDDPVKRKPTKTAYVSVLGDEATSNIARPLAGIFGIDASKLSTLGAIGRGSAIEIRRGTICPFGMRDAIKAARDAFPQADAVRQRPDSELQAAVRGRGSVLPAPAAAIELAARLIERGDDASLPEARRLVNFAAADVNAPADVDRLAACVLANGVGGDADFDGAAIIACRLVAVLDEAAIGFVNAHRQDLLWRAAKLQADIRSAHAMPAGSLIVIEGRLASGNGFTLLRGPKIDAPAEPKMALECGNIGHDGRLTRILCRAKGKGLYRVLATQAQEPKYTFNTRVENAPQAGDVSTIGNRYVVRVSIRNTGVQPLHKITFAVSNPAEKLVGQQRPWRVESSIEKVPPGEKGEVVIRLDGYEHPRGGERLPDVNVVVDNVEW